MSFLIVIFPHFYCSGDCQENWSETEWGNAWAMSCCGLFTSSLTMAKQNCKSTANLSEQGKTAFQSRLWVQFAKEQIGTWRMTQHVSSQNCLSQRETAFTCFSYSDGWRANMFGLQYCRLYNYANYMGLWHSFFKCIFGGRLFQFMLSLQYVLYYSATVPLPASKCEEVASLFFGKQSDF